MNITPEAEPLGSEHQARDLAQRALELANEIEPVRDYKIKKLTLWNPAASEIVAILRHYAEIAPKWQAVLDAEVVATVCGHSYPVPEGVSFSSKDWDRLYALPAGTELIIKPAP